MKEEKSLDEEKPDEERRIEPPHNLSIVINVPIFVTLLGHSTPLVTPSLTHSAKWTETLLMLPPACWVWPLEQE